MQMKDMANSSTFQLVVSVCAFPRVLSKISSTSPLHGTSMNTAITNMLTPTSHYISRHSSCHPWMPRQDYRPSPVLIVLIVIP